MTARSARGRRWLRRTAISLAIVAGVLLVPAATAAQRGPEQARPGIPKTDQQKSGEAIFQQNCTLCHVFSGDKKRFNVQSSTELVGLYKRPTITDEAVRGLIAAGLQGRMPSFRHTLAAWELDDLIAYLRIR